MTPESIRDIAYQALDEMKGIDIATIDVHDLTTIADYLLICTGTSTRHVKALAENVSKKAKENGLSHIRSEGERESEWILVDLGDVVVHVMLAATRAFYSLEDLWAPVKELRDQAAGS